MYASIVTSEVGELIKFGGIWRRPKTPIVCVILSRVKVGLISNLKSSLLTNASFRIRTLFCRVIKYIQWIILLLLLMLFLYYQ